MAIKAVTTGTVVGTPTVVMGTQFGIAAAGARTNVAINGGATLPSLSITGVIPVTCSNTTASGTAQLCSTGLSITPTAGNCITYLTNTANTGALTLNVDSSSAYGVYKWGGSTAVASGDIPANKPIPLCFDAASHWDASDIGNAPSGGGGNYVNITSGLTASGCTISGSAPYVCTVGTAVSSITISSIPGTYLNLELVMNGTNSTAAPVNVFAQFNGDSGSDYDYVGIYTGGGISPATSYAGAASSAQICGLGKTGSFAGGGKVVFPGYSGTAFYKTANGDCYQGTSSTSFAYKTNVGMAWHSTAAITSITLILSAGNFSAGDTFVLYGTN
jgi:hypothetical protein